jgi:electron transfer flavoprotein alpha subunit
MFIELRIAEDVCAKARPCQICVDTCPVDAFLLENGKAVVNPTNEDECILCNFCLDKCPTNAVTIKKLYDD